MLNLETAWPASWASRSADRTARLRLRSRIFGRGLSDDQFIPGIQFSGGHGREGKVSHAEPNLNRLEGFVGIQLPDDPAVLPQAIRNTPAILAASCSTCVNSALLRP